jgi:hypothetical protein
MPWPPTPEEVPSFGEVVESLDELFWNGTQAHRRAVPRQPDLYDQVRDRLAEADRGLLSEYEEYLHEVMRMWGEDRFRIGYALGTSLGRWFTDQGLAD